MPSVDDRRAGDLGVSLLVGRAQSGHAGSMDILLRSLQGPLFRHIESLTRDADMAEDVLQATFWTIARKLGQLRDPQLFRAWAYRIASRLAVRAAKRDRAWRQENAKLQLLSAESPIEPQPEPVDVAEIEDILAGLSEASAVAIRMRYIDELSYAEIAEALDIPLGTVKSRISYGLRALRSRAGVRDVEKA